MLKTLADLGYEAREGMETAWVKDGRIVMRRASNPAMGVEIKGSEPLQFRPVRFGAAESKGDRSRNREIETVWCSDFDKLCNQLLAQQGELKIDQALAVGAVEVLFEADTDFTDARRPLAAPLKTRER